YEWDKANAVGDVAITVPALAQQVVIPKGFTGPVYFKVNGISYVAQPVKELQGERRFAFVLGPDTRNDPSNSVNPLPTGQYTVDITTAEMTTGRLTHAETYAPPQVRAVTLTQPANSNKVTVQASYATGDPVSTSIDFYYTTDAAGGSGTFLQSV